MRILVIRLSALGDIVMASGLIPALRARWPDAHVAWLAEPAGAVLLEANPRLDEVIRLPRPRCAASQGTCAAGASTSRWTPRGC